MLKISKMMCEHERSILCATERIRREERERCAEVAAEVVKAWPTSISAKPELLKLAKAIHLKILQPPVAP